MKIRILAGAGVLAVALAAVGDTTAAAQQNPTVGAADRSPCRDPWINIAYRRFQRRAPRGSGERGECNIHLYGGGSWNSFAQLVQMVAATQRALGSDAYFTEDGSLQYDWYDHNWVQIPAGELRIETPQGVVTDGTGRRVSRIDADVTVPLPAGRIVFRQTW